MKIAAGILSGTERRKENSRLCKNGANLYGFRGGKKREWKYYLTTKMSEVRKLLADLCSRIRRMLLRRPGGEEAEARIMIRFATCSTIHASSSQLTHLHTSASQMKISLLKIKLFLFRKLRRAFLIALLCEQMPEHFLFILRWYSPSLRRPVESVAR